MTAPTRNLDDAPMFVDLSSGEYKRLLAFANATLTEIANEAPSCSPSSYNADCKRIVSAHQHVSGTGIETLTLVLLCHPQWPGMTPARPGSEFVNVTLLEELGSGNLTMINLHPRSLLPQCTQNWLAEKIFEIKITTKPANPDEAAAFHRENLAPERSQRFGQTADVFRRRHSRNAGWWAHFGQAQPTRSYRKWLSVREAAATSTDYALGDTTTEADVNATLRHFVSAQDERVYAASLPASYDPFEGSPCVADYVARNQGSCGSCYAFAASTAFSLQACMVLHRHGGDASKLPVFTAQGIISCGATKTLRGQPYVSGCDGGNGGRTFQYMIDHGVTTVGCWPYEQAGGNFRNHFNTNGLALAECRDTCVPESSVGEMRLTSGAEGGVPVSFATEANIAAAIRSCARHAI